MDIDGILGLESGLLGPSHVNEKYEEKKTAEEEILAVLFESEEDNVQRQVDNRTNVYSTRYDNLDREVLIPPPWE